MIQAVTGLHSSLSVVVKHLFYDVAKSLHYCLPYRIPDQNRIIAFLTLALLTKTCLLKRFFVKCTDRKEKGCSEENAQMFCW